MIGILIVSHGDMAAGMKDSLELIMGEVQSLDTASLVAGQAFDSLKEDMERKIKRLDDGNGVIIYVDLFGASPYNASMYLNNTLKGDGVQTGVVTGMNLSMLLECIALRDTMSLDELVETAVQSGREGIIDAVTFMEAQNFDEESEGDY